MKNLLILLLPAATWAYDWTCNLYCYNDGICQHGKGKFGSYAGVEEEEEMPWEQEYNQAGLYCSCPLGYTGLQCEIKLVVCGENGEDQHTCFNGAECQKDRAGNGDIFYRCECDSTQSKLDGAYAGRYCEHIATSFCDEKGEDGSFGASTSFCTNGGACKEKEEGSTTEHPGCDCPPAWEGAHCEIPIQTKTQTEQIVAAVTNEKFIGRVIGIIVLAVFLCLVLCMFNDRRKKKKMKEKERKRRLMGGISERTFEKRRSQDYEKRRSQEVRSSLAGEMA